MEQGLYIVATDPAAGYIRFAEWCVKAGVPMLQLRDKRMDDRRLLETARTMREITRGTSTRLVINDRADIAVLCDADYLHIGLSDISVSDARKIVGGMKIGLSAETLAEVRSTDFEGVDYIGAGPVFSTVTKAVPVPPLGIPGLAETVSLSPVPVVAIGGINPSNLSQVKSAGVQGWAMVSVFAGARDFGEFSAAVGKCL